MIALVTNDDGIDSAGLAVLAGTVTAVVPAAEVWVVAPAVQQSGCSHAMTLHAPLRINERGPREYSVTGTSTDCVFLSVHHVLPEPPGLVLSGINFGANLGDDLHYSGTAAAAAEATLLGIPSLAVSVAVDFATGPTGDPAWETAAHFVKQILPGILRRPLSTAYLNLNVPDVPVNRVRGLRVCALGRRRYVPRILHREDGVGRPYYWLSARHDGFHESPGSDGQLVAEGYATLTPVDVGLTAHTELEALRAAYGEGESVPLSGLTGLTGPTGR